MAQTEVALAVFLLIALAASIASRKIKTPYTTLLVVVGLAVASFPISQFSGVTNFFNNLANGGLFIGLVLPPLLFESIMTVKAADFRATYRPSLLLATFGVLVSTLVVGVILWKVVGLSILVSFLFAALISPTDVATVLEVFSRVRVPTRLATLIEMESVFNDATGIALFTLVLTTAAATTLRPVAAVVEFSFLLAGGVLVGLGVALMARYVQRLVEDPVSQVVLTLVAVYGSYGLATSLGFSGLIAVAITGLYYGNTFIIQLENKRIAETTREFWRVLAFVANAVAFFFIGINTSIVLLIGSLGAFLLAYGVVVMARITSVFPIMSLTKVAGSPFPLSWMNTTALGGMRGALAIVLVAGIIDGTPGIPVGTRSDVATLTFGVVVLSIALQGFLLGRYTRRVYGRQETLSSYDTYGSMADIESPSSPAEDLSPDEEGRAADELRGGGPPRPAEGVLLQDGRELPQHPGGVPRLRPAGGGPEEQGDGALEEDDSEEGRDARD